MIEPKPPVIIKAYPKRKEYRHSEERFLRALGLCVSQWAFVDRQLFRLFRWGLQAATHRAATVYYAQRTLSQRVKYVDMLLEQNLSPRDYTTHWKPLSKKLDDLIPVRNIFVHHPMRRLHTAKDGKPVYEYGIHIEPYERHLNRRHKGLNNRDHLDVDDLRKHAKAVDDLVVALEAVVNLGALAAQLGRGQTERATRGPVPPASRRRGQSAMF